MLGEASLRRPRFGFPLVPVLLAAAAVILVAAAFLLLDSGDSDKAPNLADPAQTGRSLVETYMSLLSHSDGQGLESFLSDAFLRQGAEGSFYGKADYLANLPRLGEYTISDVTARQAGDALVVRWLFTVKEVIDGKTLGSEPMPRLATFIWSDGEWKLLSHANFNPPAVNPN